MGLAHQGHLKRTPPALAQFRPCIDIHQVRICSSQLVWARMLARSSIPGVLNVQTSACTFAGMLTFVMQHCRVDHPMHDPVNAALENAHIARVAPKAGKKALQWRHFAQGQVKQIVGGSLRDGTGTESAAQENFVSAQPSSHYAQLYKRDGLTGGHVIILGQDPDSITAAEDALAAWPGGLQLGGGVTTDNAQAWLGCGADKVIVTSFAFKDGQLHAEQLASLVALVGKQRLVLDLSCRRRPDGAYYVVTDRWQKFTDYRVST